MVFGHHPRPAESPPPRERHNNHSNNNNNNNATTTTTSVVDALLARVSQPALKKQARRGGLSRFYASKSQSFSSIHDLLAVSAPYSRAAALLLSKRPSFDSENSDGSMVTSNGGSLTCSASWGALDGSVCVTNISGAAPRVVAAPTGEGVFVFCLFVGLFVLSRRDPFFLCTHARHLLFGRGGRGFSLYSSLMAVRKRHRIPY